MGNFDFNLNLFEGEESITNDNQQNNFINGTIKIENNNFRQKIINSYENWKKENPDEYEWNKEYVNATPNEEKIKKCEIYITEGDSASGNLKMARNNEFQAVMPVRGKILNTQKASLEKIKQNAEKIWIKTYTDSLLSMEDRIQLFINRYGKNYLDEL